MRTASIVLTAALLAVCLVAPAEAGSRGSAPNLSLRHTVIRYFAYLNGGQYGAAWLLEAPCGATFTIVNPHSAPPGSGSLEGGGPRPPSRSPEPDFRNVRIRSVHRFTTSLLSRAGFVGFHVNGWFRFAYPSSQNRHPDGYHDVVTIVRRCAGRWGIDASWLQAGGVYNWT
ncbi:MAG: hypothetical protein ACR2JC_08795 [Chloroflexota bacterium]|nr:MAG: hypothetical protein DLM70_12025 [Chloroflexota bacterium]